MFYAEHANAFIEQLTGDKNSICHFQLFYDPKDGSKRPDLASTFVATIEQATPKVQRAVNHLQGVYVCINETDRMGRDIHNITKVRAVFADFDNQVEPKWPIQPHFITRRDETHGHAFWLVDDVKVDDFMFLQYQIALSCDTDTQVTDPSRVVRLPGTQHLKDPSNPTYYFLTTVNNIGRKYSKSDIENAFTLSSDNQDKYDNWINKRTANTTGSGFNDSEIYRNKYIKFISEKAEPAVEGSGTSTLYKVTAYGYDHGLSLETAQELAWEYYNPRCIPPWSEFERQHFNDVIARSYQYSHNEPGCKTAQAAFIAAPSFPPPPPERKAIEVVRNGDRMGKPIAETNLPMATIKTPHYELAQIFDGVVYDGTNLIRCKKIFYEYGGRSWDIVDDDVVKARIQRFYSKFSPPDRLVMGIYKSLSDLCNVIKVENGIWLNSGKPTDNIVCFANGLVDLSENKAVMSNHTPNFFCFNELDYDYNPSAKCPQWLTFLNDIFEDDLGLIAQLQEWFGYCMTTDTSLEKFAAFIGKSRSGKGTITNMLRMLVGEKNTSSPSLSKLSDNSTLALMATSSLAFIPDAHSVHASRRDDVLSSFKAITGNDPLNYHVMYKGSQSTLFKVRFVLSTNNMPEFIDASGALAARLLAFPFTKSYVGREDFTLKARLITELEGVSQWALDGLRRLRINGRFTESHSSIEQKELIKHDMNPISGFVENVCVISDDAFVTNERLYDTYLLWCKQHRVLMPMSPAKLSRLMNATDLPIKQDRRRVNGARTYGFSGLNVVQFPVIENSG